MFCVKCGAELAADAKACAKCGAPVEAENKAGETVGKQYMVPLGEAARRFCTVFSFKGRISRSEYLWSLLVGYALLSVVSLVLGWIPGVVELADIALTVAFVAIGWRRMHDLGYPGWLTLIPVLNLLCLNGSVKKENKYGPVPNMEPVVADKKWTIGSIVTVVLGALIMILGMGASSANDNAQVSSAMMKGRVLYNAITCANLDRESAGYPPIWPHRSEVDGLSDETDDIAGKSYATADDYFIELLDLKNAQTGNWEPYVTDVNLGTLNLKGDKSIRCDWMVAEGIVGELEESIPVLVSSNVDPASIVINRRTDPDDTTLIKIGSAVGRGFAPWADKYVVVVRMGGLTEKIPADMFCLKSFLRGAKFDGPVPVRYLDVAR